MLLWNELACVNKLKGATPMYVATYVDDAYLYLEPTHVLKRRILFLEWSLTLHGKTNISNEFCDILPKGLLG
jgi:hypothetical protein